MNTIQCPHCKKQVELSEAIIHQMRETVRTEQEAKHKVELEKTKLEAEEKALKRVKEETEFKLKNAQIETEEKDKRNRELQQQILEFTKELRELKRKDDEREIEMQRALLKERERMELEIGKNYRDKAGLETAELKKQLDDTKKALEDAQRKADQKSQQLQGEVLELDLESQLREHFPADDIQPVPKGIEGADICHKVRNNLRQTAGLILWETKRTKAWSNSWTVKLREEKRHMNASVAILVSDILPNDIVNFSFHENVWVCTYEYALPLVNVLRIGLFELAVAKSATANKDEKLEALFSYLVSDGFRNRFESQVESIITLRADLEAEQRSTIRLWKRREIQLKRLMSSVATMYGELQGVMGEALPTLPSLESGLLLQEKNEQESLLE